MKSTFIFDIDHTLYPFTPEAETEITSLIDAYMVSELGLPMDQAIEKRQRYYHLFGTTLAGLLYFEEINAQDYLRYKDNFNLDILNRDEAGLEALRKAKQRKIAITNSHYNHGQRVLSHLEIENCFHDLYAIEQMGFWGKPFRKSFDMVFESAKISPQDCVFFEDSPRNLSYPKELGMTTILVNDHFVPQGSAPGFVDHHVSDLNEAMEIALAL